MIRQEIAIRLWRKILIDSNVSGGLAEWSNAPHLKCGWGEIPSEVRILYPPLTFECSSNPCPSVSVAEKEGHLLRSEGNVNWNMNAVEKAKKIISEILYITIASISKDGKPWNTPVYSAFDEKYNFFWASWKENEHSKNIQNNPEVFIVIYDSTVPEGTGEGLYIKARAFELNDPKEIQHALKYLYGRKKKIPRNVDEFLTDYPRRVYKAVPEKFWINVEGEVNGNYVDKRIEVKLF